jgi:hypothetical protein
MTELFREEIQRQIFRFQPQSSFHTPNCLKTPGSQALVLRVMPQFLQAKVADSGSFDPSLPQAITLMLDYLARPLHSADIYSLPGSNAQFTSKDITSRLCRSICNILETR